MSFALESVWPRLNAALHRHLGPERYSSWISNVRLLRAEADSVSLAVPNPRIRERVAEMAGIFARDFVRRITNRKLRLVFLVDPGLFPAAAEPSTREQSFGTFLVGRSSRSAYRAAWLFARGTGRTLILSGPPGSGKTHLLRAVERELPRRSTLAFTGTEFARQHAAAAAGGMLEGFRRRCLSPETLLLDDFDHFCGRPELQAEFLDIYLALAESGKRVALTCTRPPRSLEGLSRSCRARLRAESEVRLEPPDPATVAEILRARAPGAPAGTLRILASETPSNLKDAIACLERLAASGPLSPARARAAARDLRGRWSDGLNLTDIARATAEDFRVPVGDLYSHKRSAARARQACWYLARKLLAEPYKTIGRHFGGRNHSTVVLAVRKFERDGEMRARVRRLEKRLSP